MTGFDHHLFMWAAAALVLQFVGMVAALAVFWLWLNRHFRLTRRELEPPREEAVTP